jgi:hypothetical protein
MNGDYLESSSRFEFQGTKDNTTWITLLMQAIL